VPRQFENRDPKLALQWQSEGRSPTTEIALPIETQRRNDGDEPYRGHYRLVIFLPDGSKPREICERITCTAQWVRPISAAIPAFRCGKSREMMLPQAGRFVPRMQKQRGIAP
jgi:hypothetical protein